MSVQRCQSKCGSVGGMQYHYERCTGNAPRFKCDQCDRTYESRTGLNYHMASSHINEPSEDNKVNIYLYAASYQFDSISKQYKLSSPPGCIYMIEVTCFLSDPNSLLLRFRVVNMGPSH